MTDRTDTIADAAKALGMAPEEVLGVYDSSVGELVQTKDGQFTVIRDDGSLVLLAKPTPTYGGDMPVLYPDLDLHAALGAVGVDPDEDVAKEVPPTPVLPEVPEQNEAEVKATVEAHVDQPGPQPVDAPVDAPVATGDDVPDGTASEVEAWVGDDPERAARALEVEQGRDKPRKTLTEHLEGLVGES